MKNSKVSSTFKHNNYNDVVDVCQHVIQTTKLKGKKYRGKYGKLIFSLGGGGFQELHN